jgi:hypothetical protein
MPAREQARAGAKLLEQRDRVLDARRPLVVKRRWNLQIDPFYDSPPGRHPAAPSSSSAPTLSFSGWRVNYT